KAALEILQWNDAILLHPPPRRRRIVAFEVLRHSLVQPRWHATRRDPRNHRVSQLVDEHAFEELRGLHDAGCRYADAPVVDATSPGRRLRDVAELLLRVEHHHHRLGWI